MKDRKKTFDWLEYRIEAWALTFAVPGILATIVWTIELNQLDQNSGSDKILASVNVVLWIVNYFTFITHKKKSQVVLSLIENGKINPEESYKITTWILALHAGNKELRNIFLSGRNIQGKQ